MKKVEVIKILKENMVHYTDDMTYWELMKEYKKWKKWNDETKDVDFFEEIKEETQVYTPEEFKRKEILDEIINFMPSIVKKSKGTPSEISTMFRLYNSFYKAQEKSSCASCVGNVFNRMVALYKRSK